MRDGGYEHIGSFFEFADRFRTEEDCRSYLFSRRWPNGFACPRCGGVEHYHISTRDLYECAYCRYQASLTAGTIMEKTQTPLRAWFYLIFLMASMKTGISILGAARLLGISYKRAWLTSHKIRSAMAERDARYRLAGLVELDESYFGGHKSGKHGRGATGKRAVLIGVSVEGNAPRHARMRVLEGVKGDDIKSAVGGTIQPGARVATDGFVSYIPALAGYEHDKRVLGSGKEASEKLPWVHVLAANAKGMVRGVHHGVSPRHLQAYLSEFCWRFSRRSFTGELFDRLLYACITGTSLYWCQLVESP
jgi:transposase-like protein